MLEEKIYEIVKDYEPSVVRTHKWSVDMARAMIRENPEKVINILCHIISELNECLEEVSA